MLGKVQPVSHIPCHHEIIEKRGEWILLGINPTYTCHHGNYLLTHLPSEPELCEGRQLSLRFVASESLIETSIKCTKLGQVLWLYTHSEPHASVRKNMLISTIIPTLCNTLHQTVSPMRTETMTVVP